MSLNESTVIGRMPINLPIMIFSDLYGHQKIRTTPAWQDWWQHRLTSKMYNDHILPLAAAFIRYPFLRLMMLWVTKSVSPVVFDAPIFPGLELVSELEGIDSRPRGAPYDYDGNPIPASPAASIENGGYFDPPEPPNPVRDRMNRLAWKLDKALRAEYTEV